MTTTEYILLTTKDEKAVIMERIGSLKNSGCAILESFNERIFTIANVFIV